MSLRFKGGIISATAPTISTTAATGIWNPRDQFQNASTWPLPPYIVATGGTITDVGSYRYHAFTTSGTFAISVINTSTPIEYLIVGGGGSGGTGTYGLGANNNGAAGGGGGVRTGSFTATVNSWSLTVGGGAAGVAPENNAGSSGFSSSGFSLTSNGGSGNSGLSGGSSGSPTTFSGGGPGTYAGGGGGGSAGAGSTPSGNTKGNGGIGYLDSRFTQFGAAAESGTITANPTANGYFAGGGQGAGAAGTVARSAGGGGASVGGGTPSGFNAGVVNTGGGSAGGYAEGNYSGNGGSGIVLVRYLYKS